MTAEGGDRAPKVRPPRRDRRPVSLSDLRRASVYFYPKAFTPGCTTQACDLRNTHHRFIATGYAVVESARIGSLALEVPRGVRTPLLRALRP